jgi:hypothetical protein
MMYYSRGVYACLKLSFTLSSLRVYIDMKGEEKDKGQKKDAYRDSSGNYATSMDN